MRAILIAGVVLLLWTPAQAVEPIEGKVTVGSAPIRGATLREEKKVTLQGRGKSARVTLNTVSRVDATLEDGKLVMRVGVLDSNVSLHNFTHEASENVRRDVASTVGNTVEFFLNVDVGVASLRQTSASGEKVTRSLDGENGFAAMVKLIHIGGREVSQDAIVASYRFGDLFVWIEPEQADLAYTLRAVGRADYAGRPVVVLESEGAMLFDGRPMAVEGRHLVDLETGAAVFSERVMEGENEDGNAMTVRMEQRLFIE